MHCLCCIIYITYVFITFSVLVKISLGNLQNELVLLSVIFNALFSQQVEWDLELIVWLEVLVQPTLTVFR